MIIIYFVCSLRNHLAAFTGSWPSRLYSRGFVKKFIIYLSKLGLESDVSFLFFIISFPEIWILSPFFSLLSQSLLPQHFHDSTSGWSADGWMRLRLFFFWLSMRLRLVHEQNAMNVTKQEKFLRKNSSKLFESCVQYFNLLWNKEKLLRTTDVVTDSRTKLASWWDD